jgi:hypothetical protein
LRAFVNSIGLDARDAPRATISLGIQLECQPAGEIGEELVKGRRLSSQLPLWRLAYDVEDDGMAEVRDPPVTPRSPAGRSVAARLGLG